MKVRGVLLYWHSVDKFRRCDLFLLENVKIADGPALDIQITNWETRCKSCIGLYHISNR